VRRVTRPPGSCAAVSLAAAAVLLAAVAGCGEKKTTGYAPPHRSPVGQPAAEAAPPRYELYYALWWIAHSDVVISVKRGEGAEAVNDRFDRAVAGLRAMEKFLVEAVVKKAEAHVAEYERLRATAGNGTGARRVIAGLGRLRKRISGDLAPDNIDPALRKDG
jgi:hypothetical protein